MDPDVDLRARALVLATISAGGVLGALARYALGVAWPHSPTGFPWATWTINVSGCFLIGILMTLIARHWPRQRYIRPFFGVGILGGYTTFSTSIVDIQHTSPAIGLLYLGVTVVGAMLAVWAGSLLAAVGSR
jgi:CrcB protein